MNSQEDFVRVYDYIYQQGFVRSPINKRLVMDPYGSHDYRDEVFISWIQDHLIAGDRILDASCGRGHLAQSLHKLGYDVEATEVSPWLIENELSKLPFPVRLLRYDQLDQLPAKSFDCVCSSDVLEHMISREEAANAIKGIFRLSRKAVCIGIGKGRFADTYPRSLCIDKKCKIVAGKERIGRRSALNLHSFRVPVRWWKKNISNRIREEDSLQEVTKGNIFFFGMIKS
jgi:SAM-dependent methyltransferase